MRPPHRAVNQPLILCWDTAAAEGLDVAHISHTVLKGTKPALESMSAFHDITAAHTTGGHGLDCLSGVKLASTSTRSAVGSA